MFGIDDLWQMGILKRITWKCQFDLRDDFLYQRRLDRFIDQQVIRRYTSLSAVEKLAEDDALRRTFQMGVLEYVSIEEKAGTIVKLCIGFAPYKRIR